MSGNPSLVILDIPIVAAMKNAHDYWKLHLDEIDDFGFKDWCNNRWGFFWTGDPGRGTFKFEIVDQQKYTEFMLVWQ